MARAHEITITPDGRRFEVTLDGEKLAASGRVVRLEEAGLRPRYYFPRDDVRMDLLRPTGTHTTCPFKGHASYWSVAAGGRVHEDLVWSYETPIPDAERIAGLLCFYDERVELAIDGAPRAS